MMPLPPSQRIDISAAPSSMEAAASAWSKGPQRVKVAAVRPSPPPAPTPRRRSVQRPPDQKLAEQDAWRGMSRGIPDPGLFAYALSARQVRALLLTFRGSNGWRALPEYVEELRHLGLCEVGGSKPNLDTRNHLTAFGMAVRRCLMSDDV